MGPVSTSGSPPFSAVAGPGASVDAAARVDAGAVVGSGWAWAASSVAAVAEAVDGEAAVAVAAGLLAPPSISAAALAGLGSETGERLSGAPATTPVPLVARADDPRLRAAPRVPRGPVATTTGAESVPTASAMTDAFAAAPVALGRPLRRSSPAPSARALTTGASGAAGRGADGSASFNAWAPPAIVACGSSCTRLTPVTVVPSNP